jgi:hypothetical protein
LVIVEKKAFEISKRETHYYHQKDFRTVFAIHDEFWFQFSSHRGSVADPKPDPLDPHMFLGPLDPDLDPIVRGIDPDLSIIKQK